MCTGKGQLVLAIGRPRYEFLVILCGITFHDGYV